MALYEAAAARTLTPVAAPTSGRFSRGRGVQALAPTSMLAGKHLPDPPRRDPACAPARYRLDQPMDRIHHHDHTIRNCRAGAQGPPLNNENAVNARKLMVLTAFGGSERSRVCRHLGTCAGVSAVSERPRRSAGCAFSHRDIGPNRPGAWDSLRALPCVARRAGKGAPAGGSAAQGCHDGLTTHRLAVPRPKGSHQRVYHLRRPRPPSRASSGRRASGRGRPRTSSAPPRTR